MNKEEKRKEIEKLKAYYRKDNVESNSSENKHSEDEIDNNSKSLETNEIDNQNVENNVKNENDGMKEKSFLSSLKDENFTETDNQTYSNSILENLQNEDSQSEEQNEEQEENKSVLSYIKYISAFLISIVLIIYIGDQYIVPSLVHNRPIAVVPEIEGMSLEEAKLVLEDSKLLYTIVKRQYDPRLKKDHIIMQKPKAGEQVKETRPIYLTISQGSQKIKVPYLKGISIRQARVKLENKGLILGNVNYVFNEYVAKDSVISQSIKQGTEVEIGDKVEITVSKGSENLTIVPNLKYMDYRNIEDILAEYGFKRGSITWIDDETFEHGTILDQFPLPDELSDRNTYIDLIVSSNIKDLDEPDSE